MTDAASLSDASGHPPGQASGHPGSITTLHADSPAGAIDQIALLSLLGGVDVGWEALRAYIRQVVDVIV